MREFNITGLCVPHLHYMADTSAKIAEITAMVDKRQYFTINRARQYGKTTTFSLLEKNLAGRYLTVSLSFEGVGGKEFETNEAFLESHGRLLFITYLKPLINGQGFCHMETQTRNIRRMDVVVDYGKQQFVVEMKLWHGDKKHDDAYRQLWAYLDGKGMDEGYLLTFDFRKGGNKRKAEWAEYKGKKIFDAVV